MKIKNFIIYNKDKKLVKKNCNKCLRCILYCPKNKINKNKYISTKYCNICNYCRINCLNNYIK